MGRTIPAPRSLALSPHRLREGADLARRRCPPAEHAEEELEIALEPAEEAGEVLGAGPGCGVAWVQRRGVVRQAEDALAGPLHQDAGQMHGLGQRNPFG